MGALLKQTLNKARTLLRCDFEENHRHFYFYCPGCKRLHCYNVNHKNSNGALWSFNGDFEVPSFSPSLRYLGYPTGTLCHLFLTNSTLVYCSDNPHDHNGKTIPLPVIPESEIVGLFGEDAPIERLAA